MFHSAAAFHSPFRRGALRLLGPLLALLVYATSAASARAITIQFDYSHDTLGFFGTAQNPTLARTTLEFAARTFTPFTDSLAAIQPGGANSWTAMFTDPSTGTSISVPNLVVPQNTLIVYPIARNLAEGTLGQAGPGTHSFNDFPSALFSNAVSNRSQGNADLDFAPWGGVIAVDVENSSGAPRNWHYDLDAKPAADEYDFYTVVTHELAHLFGYGVSSAFTHDIFRESPTTAYFTGEITQNLYGGTVPMYIPPSPVNAPAQHWGTSVTSPPFLLGTRPQPSLGPFLPRGERKLFTPLDYAALADIGWQVPAKLFGLPGDINGDNFVDGADFLLWQRSYGGTGALSGDVNGDQVVDDFDGWILSNYFGSIGSGAVVNSAVQVAVPEPRAAALAVMGLLSLFARRRRHNIMTVVTINSCSHANPK